MAISKKKLKIGFYTLSFIFSAFVFLIVFQNCSNVHLSPIPTDSASTACVDTPEKIDQDATGATSTTTRFYVSNLSDDTPIDSVSNWSVEGNSQEGLGSRFTFNYSGLDPCATYVIHSTHQGCNGIVDSVFHYTPGTNCQINPTPTTLPPATPPVTCPATITAANGQVFTRQTSARLIERHVNDREQEQGPVDTTSWTSIFALAWPPAEPNPSPWPGGANIRFSDYNYPPSGTFLRNGYMAMAFTPTDTTTRTNGEVWQSSRGSSLFVTMTISETCGEFVNVPAGCKLVNPNRDIQNIHWSFDLPAGPFLCRLQRNHTYYLNIRLSDQTQLDPQLCPRANIMSCPLAFEAVGT